MARSTLPILALAATLILAGCMETMPGPERPRPPQPRPEKPIACTREYAPVCAAKGWRRKTFSNACLARADRYSVIANGACARETK